MVTLANIVLTIFSLIFSSVRRRLWLVRKIDCVLDEFMLELSQTKALKLGKINPIALLTVVQVSVTGQLCCRLVVSSQLLISPLGFVLYSSRGSLSSWLQL
jgi:hypothetical protein